MSSQTAAVSTHFQDRILSEWFGRFELLTDLGKPIRVGSYIKDGKGGKSWVSG